MYKGTWSQIDVAGHPCHVYVPPDRREHGPVVIYLHGVHVGLLGDEPEFGRLFDRHGLAVVSPVTGRSWWSDRVCPEFDPKLSAERYVVDHVMRFIDESLGTCPPQVALLGTSMGGQGALRFAFKHPNAFPVVAAISPAIDYQSKWSDGDEMVMAMYADAETVRQDTATLHVHPLNWPRNIWFACDPTDYGWHESAERLRMKLAALGIPYECDLETEGGGHGFAYYNQMAEAAIGFLVERLEKERLRVV